MRKLVTYLLVFAAVMALVIAFVAFRDDISEDTLGFFSNLFGREEEGEEDGRVYYDEGNIFALCDGKLAALSGDRLVLYDRSGAERVSRPVAFDSPALTVAGSKVLAYDRVGGGLLAANTGGILEEFDFPVLTAGGNARGEYVLVTEEDGYRGVARLYDSKNNPRYQVLSGERYIWAASLSPSGDRMAVAAMGQSGQTVGLRVTFHDTRADAGAPLGVAEIADEVALAVASPDNNHVCIITESGVYFYTDDGLPLGEYPFGGQTLLSTPYATSEAVFLNLGRNAGGQYSQLVCLSYTGTENDRVSFTEGPTGFAAAGGVCAVLEAGVLTRFTLDGTALLTEDLGPCAARDVLVSEDGRILLLYSGYAEWYNG
ncbi:MAG: DUF5711 family protein [Oscillospiraceae bacterium]|jgi:hypothetical protein|nr:DUF5711 family protein [Oscillospiraceae bacterium]